MFDTNIKIYNFLVDLFDKLTVGYRNQGKRKSSPMLFPQTWPLGWKEFWSIMVEALLSFNGMALKNMV